MKRFWILLFLLLFFLDETSNISAKNIKNNYKDLIKALPSVPDITLFVKSLDREWNKFKRSYFYKKYKLTKNGKKLEDNINSISASFLVIGLTFDDLLEIFSEQGLLALWVNNNSVTNYLYVIKSKKKLKLVKALIERLKIYAIAKKINFQNVKYGDAIVLNFNNIAFIAQLKNYTFISDSFPLIEKSINKISQNIINTNFSDFEAIKLLKNKNIVFFFNNISFPSSPLFYSLTFGNNLEIEAIDKNINITNSNFSIKDLRYVPSDANFIATGRELNNISQSYLKVLDMSDTNIINIDKSYFSSFFTKVESYNLSSSLIAMKLRKNYTNILFIFKNKSEISNIIKNSTDMNETYKRKKLLLFNNSLYGIQIKSKFFLSNNKKWLKKCVENYYRGKGFYYSRRKILRKFRKNSDIFIWMDIRKYLTEKALQYKKDKWTLYNAYIKSFSYIYIYGEKKGKYSYFRLKTFFIK